MNSILRITLFILISITHQSLFSQQLEKYAKTKIILTDRNITDLSKLGIETDHGQYVPGKFFVSDFSMSELELISENGFEFEILIDDVEKYYAQPNRPSEINNGLLSLNCDGIALDYDYKTPEHYRYGSMGGYLTYNDLLGHLDSMHLLYPHLITNRQLVDTIHTHDGNQLYFLRVSNDAIDNGDEPQVLYTSLHHAREANSISQMVFYLWYLLENYDKDPIVKSIVDNTQMYFIPIVNPDGYIINETNNPNGGGLWRKNGYKNDANELKGVDLNRNYGYFWGYDNQGSSNNPNSATYRGPSAFSEPESQAIRNFCDKNKFEIALNYHTFGNFLIHPWGFEDGPTAEDKVFKSLGNVMIRENNFLLGTGIETVGYTVNGDSDDWMYGDTTAKKKIYAMTPEVGYAFWPARDDIDFLNKSCVWMNLSNALLTLNYYEAFAMNTLPYLNAANLSIPIRVNRAGLKNGSAIVKLVSKSVGCDVVTPAKLINLNLGADTVVNFSIIVESSVNNLSDLDFEIITSSDGAEYYKNLSLQWISSPIETIYKDDATDISNYDALDWDITEEHFVSPPTSITDSPDREYENSSASSIVAKIDLPLVNIDAAFLEFDAKWEIEKGYDYVVVSASSDNIAYTPLCGRYSSVGTADQILNTPLYDGIKDWVHEVIDLSGFIGSEKLYIKFDFQSDQFTVGDGFYFDNLEIKVTKTASAVYDNTEVQIFPTVSTAGSDISIKNSFAYDRVVLTDAFGRKTSVKLSGDQISLPSYLTPGIYIVSLYGDKLYSNKKLVIQNNK